MWGELACHERLALYVWGELATWHAMKDSLTHHPSSQGWAPGVQTFFVYIYKCFVVSCMYLDGGMGERTQRRVATYTSLLSFLLSIIILGLACYKHTIHAYNYG